MRGFCQSCNSFGIRSLLLQRVPVVRRIAVVQHTFEDFVGVRLGTVSPHSVLVIYPSEDDDLAGAVIAEEEPETIVTELSAKPVLAIISKRGTLAIDRRCRVCRVYEYAILSTFGIRNGFGSLNDADFNVLRSASGRRPFNLRRTARLPAFVGFADEANPKTIYEIDPWKLGERFPGVKFSGLQIEITNDAITQKL